MSSRSVGNGRLAPILGLVVAAAVGCKDEEHERKAAKRAECNAFSERVNTMSADLKKLTGKRSEDELDEGKADPALAGKRRRVGEVYAKMAEDARRMTVSTDALRTHVEQYAALCTELAGTATALADFIEKGESEKAQAEQTEFNALVRRENDKIGEINGYCGRL